MAEYLKYKVVNADTLNARTKPSLKGKVFCVLKRGQVIKVAKGQTKTSDGIIWYKSIVKGTECWVSAKYLKRITPNYRMLTLTKAKEVYDTVIDVGCKHKSGAKSLSEIKSKKVTTCATSVSAALQEAGVLKKNTLVGHTKGVGSSKAVKKKSTSAKAISGKSNLIDGTYKIVKIGKKFSAIPENYKRQGTVLVYDSNIAIVKDSSHIYSTNNGASQKKNDKYVNDVAKSGYCFTSPVLFAIIPNS